MDAQNDNRKNSGSREPAQEVVGLPGDKEYRAFRDNKAKAETHSACFASIAAAECIF